MQHGTADSRPPHTPDMPKVRSWGSLSVCVGGGGGGGAGVYVGVCMWVCVCVARVSCSMGQQTADHRTLQTCPMYTVWGLCVCGVGSVGGRGFCVRGGGLCVCVCGSVCVWRECLMQHGTADSRPPHTPDMPNVRSCFPETTHLAIITHTPGEETLYYCSLADLWATAAFI